MTSATAARARLATIVLSAVLDGTFSAAHLWSAASLMVIVLVTAAVGLVVMRHQPRNPIGWLLAGTASRRSAPTPPSGRC